MSFADLLRKSRTSPTSVLHQFLTSYDPREARIYAFVEGDPDRAYYRAMISSRSSNNEKIVFINCEGKRNVFTAYEKVIARYPDCKKVLFFVDKDVDDLVGQIWPTDPRIYTTEYYSIENYLVTKEAVHRYLSDFVKLKRVVFDIEAVVAEFDAKLEQFHRAIQPLMSWIIAMRRNSQRVNLNDISMSHLFAFCDGNVRRLRPEPKCSYLCRVTTAAPARNHWRQVQGIRRQLQSMRPKTYVRGKFEAWFLIEFIKQVLEDLHSVAKEVGGNVSVTAPIHEANFSQILVRGTDCPSSLHAFLAFHLSSPTIPTIIAEAIPTPASRWRRLWANIRGVLK